MTRLRRAFDSPDTKRRYVRRLFSTIADRYDLITVLLSYGRDRLWKRELVDRAVWLLSAHGSQVFHKHGPPTAFSQPVAALDLACGTGDIAFALSVRGASVIGLDITPRMVEIAREKGTRADASGTFLVGDMMTLPFPDSRFDLVTTGYGLRNVPALDGALREIHRVLRPGGCVLSLDFDRPTNPIVRTLYVGYLTVVGSVLGTILHGDPDTYRYISASLGRYVGARGVAARLRDLEFQDVGYTPLFGGLMAVNYGRKRYSVCGSWTPS
ncbi:MAG: ubiquinone/menaquinone biosynthesis methyltransferase [Vicinamibacterales bacterium]